MNITEVSLNQRVLWTDSEGKRHVGSVQGLDRFLYDYFILLMFDRDLALHNIPFPDLSDESKRQISADHLRTRRCNADDCTAIPAEPPDGAVVLTPSGQAWQRHDDLPARKAQHWWGAGEYDYSNETWEGLILLHGLPLRVIYAPEEAS